jgi:hypothetical protein
MWYGIFFFLVLKQYSQIEGGSTSPWGAPTSMGITYNTYAHLASELCTLVKMKLVVRGRVCARDFSKPSAQYNTAVTIFCCIYHLP